MERAESQSPPRMDRRIQIWGVVRAAIVPIASVVVALVIGAVIIALSGANPLVAYSALFEGGLGSGRAFSRTLEKATPLIFGGLAVSLAFKCGLFNIGAQGQLLLGAVFAAFIGFSLHGLPSALHIPLALLGRGAPGRLVGGDCRCAQSVHRGARGDHDDYAQLRRLQSD
jgi:ABC-type uncharacterized transport system permease subunit